MTHATIKVTARHNDEWFRVEWHTGRKGWTPGWVRDADFRRDTGLEDRDWTDEMIVGTTFEPFDRSLIREGDKEPALDTPKGYSGSGGW